MTVRDQIVNRFPALATRLDKLALADLPTPLREGRLQHASNKSDILIKCDDATATLYGGNKVRKLEYLLRQAETKHCDRVATFGAVGSNHALATALYARTLGLPCTLFLTHQAKSASVRSTLQVQLAIGSQIVRFGGAYRKRLDVLRRHLWGRNCWLVPAGGSSWRGTVGFVNAGLELAAQVDRAGMAPPDRLYIASGTLGSAAGLAIGLAVAGMHCRVEAIRVSATHIANDEVLQRLLRKTVGMMRHFGADLPPDILQRVNVRLRHDFFADGYARSSPQIDRAVAVARDTLGLSLETTYTGKAFAALLNDATRPRSGRLLFWNTYNSASLSLPSESALDVGKAQLPEEFRGYLE